MKVIHYAQRQTFRLIIAGCLVLLSFTSGARQKATSDRRTADEQTLRDLDAQWSKAALARDLDKTVSYYADDAIVLPPNAAIATTAIPLPAQTFTTLHSFEDGANPFAGLVQATDGNLYGTTKFGGANGWGTVFKITPSGTLTTLYSFCNGCTDGREPVAPLVQANDGNLYGTTQFGGANLGGTVFKITLSGALTTLYSFCPQSGCTDGEYPPAGLIQATDGNFYGTTNGGGANALGTVFKITSSGTLTTLYSFCSQSLCTDGDEPVAGLVQGADGNFYGTTPSGGNGEGTVFKITPSGMLTTLHSFCPQFPDCPDGAGPVAGLIQAADRNFYGTNSGYSYGESQGGTVFKITSSGTLTTLYRFCSQPPDCPDGNVPYGLVQATDGNFYGTTAYGGANGAGGTVFKITPSGTLTTLYSFCSQSLCTDGSVPFGGLVQDTNGAFYGTTAYGGANGLGTVFGLSIGLGQFVETQPTSGKVGAAVKILGTNLTGATSVSFNGTVAIFTMVSSSLIKTTVPAGATTGKVQVVTPSRTLLSNVPFRVRP